MDVALASPEIAQRVAEAGSYEANVQEVPGLGSLVVLRFDEPQDASFWNEPACTISRDSDLITGLAVLVVDGEVTAISPEWDAAVTCIAPTG